MESVDRGRILDEAVSATGRVVEFNVFLQDILLYQRFSALSTRTINPSRGGKEKVNLYLSQKKEHAVNSGESYPEITWLTEFIFCNDWQDTTKNYLPFLFPQYHCS